MEKYRVFADGNYRTFCEADDLDFALSLAEDLIKSNRKAEIKKGIVCKDGKTRWYKVKFQYSKHAPHWKIWR